MPASPPLPAPHPPRPPHPTLLRLLGLELTPLNHTEKLLSGLGGFLAILAIALTTRLLLGPSAVMPVLASMGASCVLLFAAPHGALSQPWPLVVGHLISALVGVTCARLIPNPLLAAPAAVGIAITAMYYARAIHPPGGATALTAVLAGPTIHALGYRYVLLPTALNVAILLLVALAFNAPFPWRRYPAALAKPATPKAKPLTRLTRDDFAHALTHTDTLTDITPDDLLHLHDLARQHAERR